MIARLLPFIALAAALVGCGAKEDPDAMAAPPPKSGAVAPPAVPNAKQGGPQDMAPGSGVTPTGDAEDGRVILALPPLPAEFRIDFARWAGVPLLKTKFGVYATPFSPKEELVRSLDLVREIGVRDFRYELAWGKPDAVAFDVIGGTASAPTYDFTYADAVLDRARTLGIRPLLALSYCPTPLQTRTEWARWKDMPSDLGAWREIGRTFVAHLRARGQTDVRYEAWNEPDMPEATGKMFFEGTVEDYARLYDATVAGVRAGDPDATVGGPAAAYDLRYLAPVLAGDADFASIHGYANFPVQIANMRKALAGRPDLPILLTEYASFNDFRKDGPAVRSDAAAAFFRDADGLLRLTDVTKVYWAQWIDDYLGLVSRDGHRRAIYNAFKVYGMMPTDRVSVTPFYPAPESRGIRTSPAPDHKQEKIASTPSPTVPPFVPQGEPALTVLASASKAEAAVVVANPTGDDRTVTLRFDRLKVGGAWRLMRIDSHHASFVDDPSTEALRVDETPAVGKSWTGVVPAQGVVALFAGKPTPEPRIADGRVVREVRHFPDRASPAYADFDPATSTARLGGGAGRIGVVFDGMRRFRLAPKGQGGGTISVRAEFPGGVVRLLPTRGVVDLRRLAPAGWDGRRVTLTFALTNAKESSHVRLALLRP